MLPEWLSYPPSSTFLIFGLALAISLFSTLVNRKFINREQSAKWQEEINRWNADRNLAKKTGDKKLMVKVKKQERRILQIQSKRSNQQFKVFIINFVPIIVIWQVLLGFFVKPVAFIPLWPGQSSYPLPFFIWYIICSYFAGTIISHIFGVQMGMGMGMGSTAGPAK